jgi:spore coat polysaccharide biosynthesis protein SpsF
MKIVAVVQARMGSTRLPAKVLLDLGGQTVLQRVVERLKRTTSLDAIVVATTTSPSDEPIVKECERLGVASFRGAEQDVLDRYYQAALAAGASSVVRITADCPMVDAEVVDQTTKEFDRCDADYASNVVARTYPRGLDVEVMKMSALERAWRDARAPHEREHVTPYLREHPEMFRLTSLTSATDFSSYRWTLDTPDDLKLLRTLYTRLGDRNDFGWMDAVALMERDPQLAELNAHVMQKDIRHT